LKFPPLTHTYYQGFYGKGAFFEGKKGIGIANITDGTSKHDHARRVRPIGRVDQAGGFAFRARQAAAPLGGVVPEGCNAAFCDGFRALRQENDQNGDAAAATHYTEWCEVINADF